MFKSVWNRRSIHRTTNFKVYSPLVLTTLFYTFPVCLHSSRLLKLQDPKRYQQLTILQSTQTRIAQFFVASPAPPLISTPHANPAIAVGTHTPYLLHKKIKSQTSSRYNPSITMVKWTFMRAIVDIIEKKWKDILLESSLFTISSMIWARLLSLYFIEIWTVHFSHRKDILNTSKTGRAWKENKQREHIFEQCHV